ncbi:hypothetical protein SLE2022_238460 [Rubroshorea leprosula]
MRVKFICFGWKESTVSELKVGELRRVESAKTTRKTKWVVKDADSKKGVVRSIEKQKENKETTIEASISFVEVLKRNPHKNDVQKGESVNSCEGGVREKATSDHGEERKVIKCDVEEKDYAWLNACAVGMVLSPEIIPSLQEIFEMEGYFNIAIVPLGGSMVLLKGEDDELMKELIDNEQRWLERWFE